ncbi:hypothetical protein CCACVL1_08225 [Corchorus capsularis]|uniref:Uncharacterized protein n=1 Tax=Corchorus capsularis TaxID=210143 RepID=A0A1R3J1T6_COCAP|nr:hypothetical protein CCACVL1_08225 [Corchorus capsularis]
MVEEHNIGEKEDGMSGGLTGQRREQY